MSRAKLVLNGLSNKLYVEDAAAHEWFRFVLSYPPHLVRDYIQRFSLNSEHRVLDPFCGTGTTIVECKKLGIASIGIEANPMAHFAGQIKVDWAPAPDGLIEHTKKIADTALAQLLSEGISDDSPSNLDEERSYRTLPPESFKLLLTDSISPIWKLHQEVD